MATKRAAARAEAAETIDIAARLAPFFTPGVEDVVLDQSDKAAKQKIA